MKQNLLSLIFSAFVLTAMFSLASCGGDDGEDPQPDPCENTDLAVTATSDVFDITATGTGGTSPYKYSIDGINFQTSNTFENLDPKTYTVTVQDANECTNTTTVVVEDVCSDLAVTAAVEEYKVEATATGGTAPYEFTLDGKTQTTGIFTDVAAADYTLTVKDANACTATVAVTASDLETLLDERDGQRYKFVTIGTQVWMAENFNIAMDTARWCYDDLPSNCDAYGAMYSWYAAKEAAPEGWHLPTKAEWEALFVGLGGGETAATKLKVGGSSGFEAALVGIRTSSGTYALFDENANYWAADEYSATYVYYANIYTTAVLSEVPRDWGLYVRYIKD